MDQTDSELDYRLTDQMGFYGLLLLGFLSHHPPKNPIRPLIDKQQRYLAVMKKGDPSRLKPKSQTARLTVINSGGLSFFLFLQDTSSTVPFPRTDRTPAAGNGDGAAAQLRAMETPPPPNEIPSRHEWSPSMTRDGFGPRSTNELLHIRPHSLLPWETWCSSLTSLMGCVETGKVGVRESSPL